MMRWMLAAGAAALAISTPALADKGGQGGKGQGGGHGANAGRSHSKQSSGDRGHGDGGQMHFAGGGEGKQKGSGHGGGGQMQSAQRSENRHQGSQGKGHDRGASHARNASADHLKLERRGNGRDIRVVNVDRGRDFDRGLRAARIDRRDDNFRFVPRWGEHGLVRGFVDGCPPGLAKKGNGCLPPGQAKKIVGTRLSDALFARNLGWPYRQWYRDDDRYFYRWDSDYIYRVRRDNDLIDALFPFANRDYYYYPVGATYPDYFNYYNVPYQYRTYYPDGGDYWYRYGDGAIYMVDPRTQAISGIAALLTGAPFGVGQPLPPAYGVYNVPYAYRDQYYDTPDAWYRYNDGYIYRVDPATQLITAIISAIV